MHHNKFHKFQYIFLIPILQTCKLQDNTIMNIQLIFNAHWNL